MKKLISILLTAVMLIGMIPMSAFSLSAESALTLDISAGSVTIEKASSSTLKVTHASISGGSKVISAYDTVTVTGSTTTNNISILSGNVKLEVLDLTISVNSTYTMHGIDISSGASLDLTVSGTNSIFRGNDSTAMFSKKYNTAAIFVPEGASLTIDGEGSIVCKGSYCSSGIGGVGGPNAADIVKCGNITINGATVTASGGSSAGAGIGGVFTRGSASIIINGGNVTATGGWSSAGIGASYDSTSSEVTINGGTVTATGNNAGAGIGGTAGSSYNLITINGGYITATCGDSGSAAIGSGTRAFGYSTHTDVLISGGTVITTGIIGARDAYAAGYTASCVVTGGNIKSSQGLGITYSNGRDNGWQGLSLYTVDLSGYEYSTIEIDGVPSYYNLDSSVAIDGKYYLYLPKGTTIGDVYLDGVKYSKVSGKYTHTCEYDTKGFCDCGGYESAVLNTDKYDVNGDGVTDSVYEIGNAGQLYWFAGLVNGTLENEQQNTSANAVLVDDIVVNENVVDANGNLNSDTSGFRVWTPIGDSRSAWYAGILNGQGHYISGLYYNNSNGKYIGTVGYGNYCTVRNIGIVDSYFRAVDYVGGIVGIFYKDGTIENCYNRNTTIDCNTYSGSYGGIVGYVTYGSVSNCYSTGKSEVGIVGTQAETPRRKWSDRNYWLNTSSDRGIDVDTEQIKVYSMTAEQFASGEVAWLLNNESYNGAWKQTIGEDAYPDFTGGTVYYGNLCATEEYAGYTNEQAYGTGEHYDEEGFCALCGYEPAVLAEDGYYEIYNKGQLYWFEDQVNRYVYEDSIARVNGRLMADIVVNDGEFGEDSDEWTPIGYNYDRFRYGGVFDGNGHTVSGLYIDGYDGYAGFFGVIGEGGVVKNLGIINSYINGTRATGGIAGYSVSEISNCYVMDVNISSDGSAGGILGSASGMNGSLASINNCFSNADPYSASGSSHPIVGGILDVNCYYLSDTDDGDGGKTAAQFASGEVAYLLNGSTSEGELVWGQTIDIDAYPVFGGDTVYAGYDCGGTNVYYSNTPLLDAEDSYHVPTAWEKADGEDAHVRYICTRQGCSQYHVEEKHDCVATGTATCIKLKQCAVCGYYMGDYDLTNHESDETYYYYEEGSSTHTIYYACCDKEYTTEAHSYTEYDFDSAEHWSSCTCGAATETREAHSFDAEGFCTVCGGYEPAYFDEENYRYEISKAGHLFWFARNYNQYNTMSGDAVLTADIDLNPGYTFAPDGSYYTEDATQEVREWTPIGTGYVSYTGTFDGQGHTISGLYIKNPNADMAGLFGSTGYAYPISNINLTNGYVQARNYTGALIAYAESMVTNCHSDIYVVGSGTQGGLVGYLTGGGIYRSTNSGNVDIYAASSASGGIVGNIYYGEVSNCINYGLVRGTLYTGGIAGDDNGNTVQNCLHVGTVQSNFSSSRYPVSENAVNSYYLSSSDNEGSACSSQRLASGEITYLLQSAQPEEDIYDENWNWIATEVPTVWTQTIGTDKYPTLNAEGDLVYKVIVGGCCEANYVYGYSNTDSEPVITHSFVNGFCVCGEYEEATLISVDEYDVKSYAISNAGQLYWFAALVNGELEGVDIDPAANAELTCDITVNQNVIVNGALATDTSAFRTWTPVGTGSYNGNFNGNGYTVSGLYTDGTQKYAGMFDNLYGSVTDLGVVDSYISGTGYVGTIAARSNGKISRCYVEDSISYASDTTVNRVGGIVGTNSNEINDCYVATTNISGKAGVVYAGGIAGENYPTITNCHVYGNTVTGNFSDVIAYNNGDDAAYSNCYYLAAAEGTDGARTAEQFADGTVLAELNGEAGTTWAQLIGTDIYPIFHASVYVAEEGETVIIGDYTYTYHYNHATGARPGWNVTVNDTTLTTYGAIESYVYGLPVTIMYKTFAGCASMAEAPAIPATAEVLYNTFKYCTSLTLSPEIPEGVHNMTFAFWGCTALTSAPALPESTKILKAAFYNCTSLTSAPDLSNVNVITQAFDGCTSLTGKVIIATDNNSKAFRGTKVTSLNVTNNVTIIKSGCFSNCTTLESVIYEGIAADWANVDIENYNTVVKTAKLTTTKIADTPSVVINNKSTYICDLKDVKDVFIGRGTLATYRDVKNNLVFGMTSKKLGDSPLYKYSVVLTAGDYTLYVRHNDGSFECVNFTVK